MEEKEFIERKKQIAQLIYSQSTNDQLDVFDWYFKLGKYAEMYDSDLSDMFAYIQVARLQTKDEDTILFTLLHDLGGIYDNPEFFLPRTHNYTKRLAALEEKA